MLSEDDRNLEGMTREELAAAWDLWFDLAQTTNASDPPHSHGVFVTRRETRGDLSAGETQRDTTKPSPAR